MIPCELAKTRHKNNSIFVAICFFDLFIFCCSLKCNVYLFLSACASLKPQLFDTASYIDHPSTVTVASCLDGVMPTTSCMTLSFLVFRLVFSKFEALTIFVNAISLILLLCVHCISVSFVMSHTRGFTR